MRRPIRRVRLADVCADHDWPAIDAAMAAAGWPRNNTVRYALNDLNDCEEEAER